MYDMTHINIKISKAVAIAEKDGILTSGMVGVPVSFTFDSGWDGLAVTAVFSGSGVVKSVPLLGATETVVPWEVMVQPNTRLRIGVEGRLTDGTLVIPTTWANVGTLIPGANATDDLAKPPTPTAFDRIMSLIGNMDDLTTEAKDSLVAAINEAMTKGGVQPDYEQNDPEKADYIKNRPFYESVNENVLLLHETEFTIEQGRAEHLVSTEFPFALVEGEKYTVTFDGVVTEYTAYSVDEDMVVCGYSFDDVTSGNGYVILSVQSDDSASGYLLCLLTLDNSLAGSHTISIRGREVKLVKIPDKFIPDTIAMRSDVDTLREDTTAHMAALIYSSNTYRVEPTYETIRNWVNAGKRVYLLYDNSEILRVSDVYSNALIFAKARLSGTHTIRLFTATIYEDSVSVNKFDSIVLEKTTESGYIPVSSALGTYYADDLSKVVIKSSTSGSTKKFKLSVDDDGTLTTVEV